jgi:hypothetical protein
VVVMEAMEAAAAKEVVVVTAAEVEKEPRSA